MVQGAYGKYPDAKVLLTVKDPKKWYKSGCFIHHMLITLSYKRPYSWFVPLAGSPILHQYVHKICGLVLWGAARIIMLTIRNQAAKAKQL